MGVSATTVSMGVGQRKRAQPMDVISTRIRTHIH